MHVAMNMMHLANQRFVGPNGRGIIKDVQLEGLSAAE